VCVVIIYTNDPGLHLQIERKRQALCFFSLPLSRGVNTVMPVTSARSECAIEWRGFVVRWVVGGGCGCRGWGSGVELSWQYLRFVATVALVVGIIEAVLAVVLV
jgi:hypothetical protein